MAKSKNGVEKQPVQASPVNLEEQMKAIEGTDFRIPVKVKSFFKNLLCEK